VESSSAATDGMEAYLKERAQAEHILQEWVRRREPVCDLDIRDSGGVYAKTPLERVGNSKRNIYLTIVCACLAVYLYGRYLSGLEGNVSVTVTGTVTTRTSAFRYLWKRCHILSNSSNYDLVSSVRTRRMDKTRNQTANNN